MVFNTWIRLIIEHLDNNKKIVIAMASNNKAKDLKTYL